MALLPILCFGPMAMALVCYIAGRRSKALRDALVGITGIAVFALCLMLNTGEYAFEWEGFCAMGLRLRADGFRALYACAAAFMWMMSGLFSREYFAHYRNRNRYYFFNLMTLGATLGVFLSDDLYTTFIFFEIMSLTSYVWVAQEETAGALRAAGTYLAVAVIGGLCTLMGLFMLYSRLGTLAFDGIRAALAAQEPDGALTVAVWLTLAGFAAKAGLFPLHIWLPKAHPVAPAPASALLSGILTKSGVFGLIVICSRMMPGNAAFGNALLALATITMLLGALLALFSVDLKRTLACSSMSQIGFIAVGLAMMVLLGDEGSLAAYGAVLHMVNHSLIKLTLFMAAGVVFMNLHRLDLNDVRGFGRGKPLLHAAFLMGALSLGCIPPLGSGYASKSLLHESILEYLALPGLSNAGAYRFVEVLFIISGGLTVAYMTKLYVCLFWEKHPTRQAEYDALNGRYMSRLTAFALLGSAILLPLMGALPDILMSPLAARSAGFLGQEAIAGAIHYFSGENLLGALKSILIGAAVYLCVVRPLMMRKADGRREYVNRWPQWLDLENMLYRPVLLTILPQAATLITRAIAELPEQLIVLSSRTVFCKIRKRTPAPVGTRLTYACGRIADGIAMVLNATLLRRRPLRQDYEYVLADFWQSLSQVSRRVMGSVSFGLLLVCIGLYLTCAYLLSK